MSVVVRLSWPKRGASQVFRISVGKHVRQRGIAKVEVAGEDKIVVLFGPAWLSLPKSQGMNHSP